MHSFFKRLVCYLKATVRCIMVAFVFSICILLTFYFVLSKPIKYVFSFVDMISIKSVKKDLKNVKIEKNELTSYPGYGTNYGTLKISSIGVELPIYYGDELEILKYGVGHTPGTYFPGEHGSILYMAHNTVNMLRRLPELKKGDKVVVETTYGSYTYEIYEGKVILETDMQEVPIQDKEELLMIYTCYPVTAITHTVYRYIVYAHRV